MVDGDGVNEELLNQLKDVHLPLTPSWWPPAIGYWLGLALLLLIVILVVGIYKRGQQRRLIKKQLLRELNELEDLFRQHGRESELQAQIAALIRRTLAFKEGSLVAAQEFSELSMPLKRIFRDAPKRQELLSLLTTDRFRKETTIDGMRLLNVTKELVKKCTI